MERVTLERLVHRVLSDPTFRLQFMANPRVAISEANWDLPPRDVEALMAWHDAARGVTTLDELEQSLTAFVVSRRRRAA